MKLLSSKIFDDIPKIPGLKYIIDYIDQKQEDELLQIIDSLPWNTDLSRRVQHYGFSYDYKSKKIINQYLGALPDFLAKLAKNLYNCGIFPQIPDQVIVNEYLPGQGIAAHIDCADSFGSTICSISLASLCVMNFIKKQKIPFFLQPRSLLVLTDEARFIYKHEIPARKYDNFFGIKSPRKRRVSITFRKVIN
jgi:alkylated DNA repair dioxygenase AlkB